MGHIAADTSGTTQYLLYEGAFYGANTVKRSILPGPNIRLIYNFEGHAWDGHRWRVDLRGIYGGADPGGDRPGRSDVDWSVTGGPDELYAYDNLNRLTTSHRGDLDEDKDEITVADREQGETWTLDSVGNWSDYQYDDEGDGSYGGSSDLDQDRTNNVVNEITGVTETGGQTAWADPGYSARGNMTTAPKPTSLANTYTCKYDAWNRLGEVKSGENVVARYEYDGLNRRTKKLVDTAAPSSPDGTIDEYRHFFYDNRWRILETRNSSSENTEPQSLQPKYQYVWSLRYVDAPVLRDNNTDQDNTCNDQRLYYCTDANMNVTNLIALDGYPQAYYVYDAYGNVTFYDYVRSEVSTPPYDNSILFAGYYRDEETGLYHVRNRSYHASLGRWLQRDPIGYADGMSLYEYVRSDPTDIADPSGRTVQDFMTSKFNWNFKYPLLSLKEARARAWVGLKVRLAKRAKPTVVGKVFCYEKVCQSTQMGRIWYEGGIAMRWYFARYDREDKWLSATVIDTDNYSSNETITGAWWKTRWEVYIERKKWKLSVETAKTKVVLACWLQHPKTKERIMSWTDGRVHEQTIGFKVIYRWDKTKPITSYFSKKFTDTQYPPYSEYGKQPKGKTYGGKS